METDDGNRGNRETTTCFVFGLLWVVGQRLVVVADAVQLRLNQLMICNRLWSSCCLVTDVNYFKLRQQSNHSGLGLIITPNHDHNPKP